MSEHLLVLKGRTRKLERDFIKACRGRTRRKGLKWKEGRFGLDIRKQIFNANTVRVARYWDRLPRETVGTQSLQIFKVKLAFEQPFLMGGVPAHDMGGVRR